MLHGLSKQLELRQNIPLRVVFSTLFLLFGYPYKILSLAFDRLLLFSYSLECCQTRSFVFNIKHKSLTLTTLLSLFDVEISRFQALKYYFVEVYCKTKFIEKSVKQRQKFGYNYEKQNFGITRKKVFCTRL